MPSRLIFLLYRTALVLAFPFIVVYVALRCARNSAYVGTLGERCGFLPPSFVQSAAGAIWVHAVSVGEVISAASLVAKLKAAMPSARVFVSVSTLAGREIAAKRLGGGVADGVFYAPFDYTGPVRRVLRRLRPALVIVMETEIWPNLWHESKRAGAGLVVINGRISDKAWPRYTHWRWFFGPVLQLADRILAQTEISASRFRELGAERVELGGNLKYDFDARAAAAPPAVSEYLQAMQPGPVWIAASTMPPAVDGDVDEDEAILDLYTQLARDFPRLILILVPRRPERFASAVASLERRAIPFVRRSALTDSAAPPAARVLLLDTMGELAGVFQLADVVFMGGTLCRRGGHNILEPAFFGKAIVAGPHMENFPEIASEFSAAGACRFVKNAAELETELRALLCDDRARAELGERARKAAVGNSGATQLAVSAALEAYELALPRPVIPFVARIFTAPLAAIWRAGSTWKQRPGRVRERLALPVISVGGISVGGSGKTPFALWLAGHLAKSGRKPAFLTRGYGRVSPRPCAIVPAGGPAPIAETGDEAQLLVRSGIGPVGICANRASAGRGLIARFGSAADAFVLDDGFQHAPLDRDVDLVLIDALDPFAGFDVIPAGRLREPLSALARADAFVLMRSEPGRTYAGVIGELRRHNQNAPVFRARLESKGWVDAATGLRVELNDVQPEAGAAFCGLGNPASFWRSLEQLGLNPVWRAAFPDHHRYHLRDLRRLGEDLQGHGVNILWTTEKDMMNLPEGWMEVLGGCRVLALVAQVRVEDETTFGTWLDERLHRASRG